MTTYYPQRIKTAAATFKYSATAFVDFIFRGDLITLKLQAPEIGAQFEGPVDYGKGKLNHFSLYAVCSSIVSPQGHHIF